ncbi:MAG: hypothetical protein ABI895_14910 [Deltaproteobacteria bacterium]
MISMIHPAPSQPSQGLRSLRTRRRLGTPLLGCALGLLLGGCAERYQIGALGDTPQSIVAPDTHPGEVGVVIAHASDPGDVVVEGVRYAGRPVGDVDGDGSDDLLVSDFSSVRELGAAPIDRILYGGPRPLDGIVHASERSSLVTFPADGQEHGPQDSGTAGDLDGDGAHDLLFSTSFGVGYDKNEASAEAAEVARNWSTQQAWLSYGSRDRSAVASSGVAFAVRDDLPSHFRAELSERNPADARYEAGQSSVLRWLGDVNGDGYDDLAFTTGFGWTAWGEEVRPDATYGFIARQRSESVSYVFYGRSGRWQEGGSAPEPEARLAGVDRIEPVGDVNGDGFADLAARVGDNVYLIAGRAQRLSGELFASELGVPIQGRPVSSMTRVGDLDQDGMGDLIIARWDDSTALNDLVYGSPDLLDGPVTTSRTSAVFSIPGGFAYLWNFGDWNGDGANDLFLSKMLFAGDAASLLSPSPTIAPPHVVANEVRMIPGSSKRYEGDYPIDTFRPDLDPEQVSSSLSVQPIGDVDGDGRADLLLGFPGDPLGVRIKYGAPLAERPLH